MLPFRILLNPLLLPVVLFAGGFVAFKMGAPSCRPIGERAHIFVLTGDARRIPFAMEKLEDHPGRRLYIIGAGAPGFDTKFDSQIEVESDSRTTYENAVAIRHIARKKLLTSIVVITTADHMNRAVFLIKKQIPYADINACPAPLSKMHATKRLERWAEEYIKFIGTIIGIESRV